jgi:hypothetical protein
MLRNIAFSFFVICFIAGSAALGADGCKKGTFVGAYTRVQQTDAFGNGDIHTYLQQLTLHSDGSVEFFFSGFPDYTFNIGTGTPGTGSWTCRADDKLIVNVFANFYVPATVNDITDLVLFRNLKDTYLFAVTDQNTMTREQFRRRSYLPSADPTDPNAGTLGPLNTTTVQYKRVVASDSDLLIP